MMIAAEGFEIHGPHGNELFRTVDVKLAALWKAYGCSVYRTVIQVGDTEQPEYFNPAAGGCPNV